MLASCLLLGSKAEGGGREPDEAALGAGGAGGGEETGGAEQEEGGIQVLKRAVQPLVPTQWGSLARKCTLALSVPHFIFCNC